MISLSIALVTIVSCNRPQKISEKLWYTSPAEDWFSALPLGNGRLGAMVFGTLEEEPRAGARSFPRGDEEEEEEQLASGPEGRARAVPGEDRQVRS